MEKSFAVESVEVTGDAGSGKFEALVSVFGNVDQIRDVVMPGAFAKAIADSDPPPVVWSHFWDIPPIGNTIDWSESGKGLHVQGELFVGADDKHQYADMVYAAMRTREGRKSALREFSFSYDLPDGHVKSTRQVGDETVSVQELHTIFPVHEVGPCLKGCNTETRLLAAPKRMTGDDSDLLRRIEKLAKDRGIEPREMIEMLEREGTVRDRAYAARKAELMLAFPDH